MRTAVASLITAALALLAAACADSPGSHVAQLGTTATHSSTSLSAPGASPRQNGGLAFSGCMRSHGVHDWPDPSTDSDGQAVFDLRGRINPDTPQMDATSGRCAHLLHPAPGQDGTVLCNGIGEAGCHHYG